MRYAASAGLRIVLLPARFAKKRRPEQRRKERTGEPLETLQYLTIGLFLVSIFFVITGWIDSVLAALLGVMGMIFIGVMNDVDAFKCVDWNVIAILLSIWIISGYFGRSGVPDALAAWALKLSKGNVAFFIVMIGFIAGLVSMVIDNVVVVLMFAPVIFHACRKFKFNACIPTLFVALCANFMGTAMLLGDLPPQMLHSVSGISPMSSPAVSSTGSSRESSRRAGWRKSPRMNILWIISRTNRLRSPPAESFC
jgi:hypothetical protein